MPPRGATVIEKAEVGLTTASSKAEYTWQEVAKHNTPESAWVIIDRKVYDVTNFVDKHPGGRELMLVAAGRESTNLYRSYHCLDLAKPDAVLAKYCIGSLTGPGEFPSYTPDNGLYKTMSARVAAYFKRTGLNPKGAGPGLLRFAILIPIAAAAFLMAHDAIVPGLSLSARLALMLVYSLSAALVEQHAMHDASHGALSGNTRVWKAMGRFTMDIMGGASLAMWHHQHVVGHHVYTNVYAADPDLPWQVPSDMNKRPREAQKAPRKRFPGIAGAIVRWQHIIYPVVYGFMSFRWRIMDVWGVLTRVHGPVRVNLYEGYTTLLLKLVFVAWRILLPLYVWGTPTAAFWTMFALSDAFIGYWLAYNFVVSHLSDELSFPANASYDKCGELVVSDTWAAAQVKTSVDYSQGSAVATFLAGALNYQIEHHLFPGISQYHYPAIAPIVEQTCKEFGVPYRTERNFWQAWKAHIRLLKDLGERGEAAPLHWD